MKGEAEKGRDKEDIYGPGRLNICSDREGRTTWMRRQR